MEGLEDRIIAIQEIEIIDIINPNNKNNIEAGAVIQIGVSYFYVKDANEQNIKLGSEIRLDADKGYNFRTDEKGAYMQIDELLGLTKLYYAGKLLDLAITKHNNNYYIVFDKQIAYKAEINRDEKKVYIEDITKSAAPLELNKILTSVE